MYKILSLYCPFLGDRTITDVLQSVVRGPGRVGSVLLYQMI